MSKQRGFTLAEVLTGTAISTLVIVIAGTLMVYAVQRYNEIKSRLSAELTATRGEVLLRSYFSQAIDVGNAVALGATTNQMGVIVDNIDYDQKADTLDWTRIAAFWREDSSQRGAVAYGGLPQKTMIWYREPDRDTSGILFINTGGAGAVTPDYANSTIIDRLSGIRMTKILGPFNKVGALDVTLRVRYHPATSTRPNWCPNLDIVAAALGCGVGPIDPYKDLERTFRITLQNVLLRQNGAAVGQNSPVATEERVMGNLYFFKTINPGLYN